MRIGEECKFDILLIMIAGKGAGNRNGHADIKAVILTRADRNGGYLI